MSKRFIENIGFKYVQNLGYWEYYHIAEGSAYAEKNHYDIKAARDSQSNHPVHSWTDLPIYLAASPNSGFTIITI